MHLTIEQCFGQYGTSYECIVRWMFRTRTIFYNYDDQFHLPLYFGICCWNYVIAGIVLLATAPPSWLVTSQQWNFPFPYYTFAILLIFVQSPLSFLADYIYMDQDSIFHVIDRMIAVPLMILELWKVNCLWYYWLYRYEFSKNKKNENNKKIHSHSNNYHNTTIVVILYTFGTILAIISFLLSQQNQSQKDLNGFILWHNRWHMYPLYASIITLYDYCYNVQQQSCHQLSNSNDQERQPIFSSFQKLMSTVSSSSSLSSTITTATEKEKDI